MKPNGLVQPDGSGRNPADWRRTRRSRQPLSVSALLNRRLQDARKATRKGKPVSPTNIIRRHLHKALEELKYVNPYTRTHKAGNHAFRRYRNTYLRNYTECPAGLYKYWMGHAGEDMSDLYDKIKEDVAFRRKWAERCGFGFGLPPSCTECTENCPKDRSSRGSVSS